MKLARCAPRALRNTARGFHTSRTSCSLFNRADLKDPTLFREQAFINGNWVDGITTFDVVDPATGVKIATNPAAGSKTVEAIEAANAAWAGWKGLTAKVTHALCV